LFRLGHENDRAFPNISNERQDFSEHFGRISGVLQPRLDMARRLSEMRIVEARWRYAMSKRPTVQRKTAVRPKPSVLLRPQPKPNAISDHPAAPTHRLVDCTIEAHTLGDGARALARAHLKEIEPYHFNVFPTCLREVCGPDIPWQSAEPGEAIHTASRTTNFDQAHDALTRWATVTLAVNRQQ
jgi:hypothetical protein